MLKLTDSGCAQHGPRQITLADATAVLVARLILNLPPAADAGRTYICEHGHTHRLMFHPREEQVASTLPGSILAGAMAPVH